MAKITIKMKKDKDCKHSIRYKSTETWVNGDKFDVNVWEEAPAMTVYIPNTYISELEVKGTITLTLEAD